MREIKFRAWDRRLKKIVYLDRRTFLHIDTSGWYFTNDKNTNGEEIIPTCYDNSYLLQYTGLKDKNGKEVYEGDVLLRERDGESQHSQPAEGNVHVYDYYVVEWKNQGFNFRSRKVEVQNFNGKPWMTYESDNPMTFHNWLNKEPNISGLEIIGNVYENPELLTDEL